VFCNNDLSTVQATECRMRWEDDHGLEVVPCTY